MKIIHIPGFELKINGHGGVHRSNQLSEVLASQGADVVSVFMNKKKALLLFLKYPLVSISLIIRSIYLFLSSGLTLYGCLKYIYHGIAIVDILKDKKPNIVSVESTFERLLSIDILIFFKIKYIIFPQNVEFFVNGQINKSFRGLQYSFIWEKRIYENADAVYTISRFDKAILACMNILSEVYLYYPCRTDYIKLLRIQELRNNLMNSEGYYLMLGSVGNPPTYKGIFEFINKINNTNNNLKIIIAGFGTEVFKKFSSENLDVVGSLSNDELEKILLKCKGLIINQPQTTGFLTKIIDANLSGIPVFVISEYIQIDEMLEYGVKKINSLSDFLEIKQSPQKTFTPPNKNILSSYFMNKNI